MESGSKPAALPSPGARTAGRSTPRRIRLGAALAVAFALGFGAWLVLRGGDERSSGDGPVSAPATPAELRALPAQAGHPVYWAGPREGFTYEVTRPTDGNVYIRYLPPGVSAGDKRPAFTTIGTYPRANALRELRQLASQSGAVTIRLRNRGIGVYTRARPESVYIAYPGRGLQIEVYDPSPRKARQLARSGRVTPVG